jgi:chemotaxis protein MotB
MARKNNEPPVEEGAPMWIMTFADMVSLLLCFFILLLSFAKNDLNQFKTLMGSIQNAFGVQVKRKEAEFAAFSPTQFERKELDMSQDNQQILGMMLQLKSMLVEDPALKESARITAEKNGLVMRVPSQSLFQPGSATLRPDVSKVLDKVAAILKENTFNLVIRANSDDRLPDTSPFPSNWELTSSRAAATLRHIVEKLEIPPSRIKAVGFADSLPLVPNNTAKNRSVNRRIEFFFHRAESFSW